MPADEVNLLSSRIAEALLQKRQSRSKPRDKARTMVVSVLAKCPDAKLPELIKLAEMQEWMTQHGITESQLREALTLTRRELRSATDALDVKRPRRRRRSIGTQEPVTAERGPGLSDTFGGAIVDNGPISEL